MQIPEGNHACIWPAERKELDLHLLICPECNYDYAQLLLPRAREAAEGLLQGLERGLTADLVARYLPDLAGITHCDLRARVYRAMVKRLLGLIDLKADNMRIYHLCAANVSRVETPGVGRDVQLAREYVIA